MRVIAPKFKKQVVWTGSATSVDLESLPGGFPGPGLYCAVVDGSPTDFVYGPVYVRGEPVVSGDSNIAENVVAGGVVSDGVTFQRITVIGLNRTFSMPKRELTISTGAVVNTDVTFNQIWRVTEA